MKRQFLPVSLGVATLIGGAACGHDNIAGADGSVTGQYALSRVFDVPMPAMVKDPGTQMRLLFRRGTLVLRPDSTFDLRLDAVFVDYDIVPDGHHFGPYHWTASAEKLELQSPSTGFRFQGTAGRDTVRLNEDMGYVRAPPPVYDFVFVRASP